VPVKLTPGMMLQLSGGPGPRCHGYRSLVIGTINFAVLRARAAAFNTARAARMNC